MGDDQSIIWSTDDKNQNGYYRTLVNPQRRCHPLSRNNHFLQDEPQTYRFCHDKDEQSQQIMDTDSTAKDLTKTFNCPAT